MATQAQRQHLGAIMDMLVRNEPLIHYVQHRPMQTLGYFEQELADRFAAGKSISCDCSESSTLVCKLAGLETPWEKDGYGNTQTMLDSLKHYTDPHAADVGALVVFGRPGHLDEQHVCIVRKRGRDPLLWSHGQERGPFYIHLSDEARAHGGPVTFLSIAKL